MQAVAATVKRPFVLINSKQLVSAPVSGHLKDAALQHITELGLACVPSLVIIDDVDMLCRCNR